MSSPVMTLYHLFWCGFFSKPGILPTIFHLLSIRGFKRRTGREDLVSGRPVKGLLHSWGNLRSNRCVIGFRQDPPYHFRGHQATDPGFHSRPPILWPNALASPCPEVWTTVDHTKSCNTDSLTLILNFPVLFLIMGVGLHGRAMPSEDEKHVRFLGAGVTGLRAT